MDKNMIHIDDFVRQRLGGGEEPDRPGAWLSMRELLDKEMPVVVANSYNWRRIVGYFTGLLLLTTAAVGGYKMVQNNKNNQLVSGGSGINYNTESSTTTSGAPQTPSSNNTNTIVSAAEIVAKPGTSSASNTSTSDNSNNTTDRTAHPANHRPHRSASGVQSASANNVAANSSSSGRDHQDLAVQSTGHQDSQPSVADHNISTERNIVHNNAAQNTFASAVGASVLGRRSQRSRGDISSRPSSALQASVNSSMAAPKSVAAPANVRYTHDTIERLELVARRFYDATTQKIVMKIDTIPMGKVVVARVLPNKEDNTGVAVAKQDKDGLKLRQDKPVKGRSDATAGLNPARNNTRKGTDATIIPASQTVPNASTATASASENSNLVSLSKFKVSSRHYAFWDADRIDAAINKFKFNLARVQMYPGLMAGINGSFFTPNSLGGFQVGLTSLFVLNDWWSLLTELKYLHRFNTGSTVRDDYTSVTNGSVNFTTVGSQSYKEYWWTEENVDHYFNYEVIKTFEVPLALRYSWGRFYAQGGLNFVYSTKIDAKEVTHFKGNLTPRHDLRPATHDDEPFVKDDHALVKIEDFGSKFGTGYLLGAGFSFTPAVYLDFRLAQSFWNNAKTEGAKQISRDLLRTPSIQLSVGYRFAQKH